MITLVVVRASKKYISPQTRERMYEILVKAISRANHQKDIVNFLTDLLSEPEREMLAKRLAIAYLLVKDTYTYREVSQLLKVGLETIQRVARVLNEEGEGYRKIVRSLMRDEKVERFMEKIAEQISVLPTRGKGSAVWREVHLAVKKSRRSRV